MRARFLRSAAYYFSPHFVYTVILRPPPLRALAHKVLLLISPRHLHTMGVVLALNPRDPIISGTLTLRIYEVKELKWVKSVLRPGMKVLDVGGNIGVYTAIMSKAIGAEGRLYAFEPDPTNYSYLSDTIALNNIPQATALQKAVGSEPGTATLYLAPDNKGDHRLYGTGTERPGCPVEVVALDQMFPDQVFDFIKIDIQGFELHAFRGMEQILKRNRDIIVFTEFWPQGLELAGTSAVQFLAFVRSLGFEISELLNGAEEPIADDNDLIARYPNLKYGNLVLRRTK
jgi:FkbM family methyltransferase